jgi:tRNA(fMet)-specific endonuclease VapC
MVLLDTDSLDHFHRSNANVLRRVREAGLSTLAITVVTRIEILQARFEYLKKADSAAHLQTAQYWLDESERLLGAWRIIPINEAACLEFVRLRAERRLRKIGRTDLLIASIAIARRATLVTRNTRDFALVPGLSIENWVD